MTARLRILRAVIGGDLSGNTLVCPSIGHPPRDRGTSYTDRPGAPDNLLTRVHNGNGRADDLAAKDRALRILGELPAYERRRSPRHDPVAEMQARAARRAAEKAEQADRERRIRRALEIWNAGTDPRQTVVDTYLNSRGLELSDEIAGHVIRLVERCPFGQSENVLAMIAIMRDVVTGKPQAIHRTALTANGRKIGRKMLGPVAGTAVMLDPEDAITAGLAIGEGIETCLAARQLGIRPTWALGSVGAIRTFAVLPRIEALTILCEAGDGGASEAAAQACGERWHAAGRRVTLARPRAGGDMNDVVREARG